ncbi:family 16 glycosylhydrolase [uncultured Bacteroides sp.]|uniref:family 43 glycosylhydrolase n=2 Tax=uncultured Bacteroides sp. TaxID=162156 RepID=UPI0025F4F685|nr:family 16 glycosylhydrolase [uncultured Bacteroides sp.]
MQDLFNYRHLLMMKNNNTYILLLLLSTFPLFATAQTDDWQLVWGDEFNTEGRLSPSVWNYEQGYARNEEAQWYQPDNASCKGGLLVIEARKEKNRKNPLYVPGSNDWRKKREFVEYTSSSVTTAGKKEFLYGRFEVRARIPVAKGAWPAIWTLGSNMEWPSCGEIDIMEYYQIKGTPHILANAAWGTDKQWSAKWNSKATPYVHFTEKDPDWASKFHIWRMDWDEEAIKLYLDDELLNEIPLKSTVNGSIGKGTNPFTKPQYLLLNLAIGGINGGPIDESALPMKYEIDYVRVYQQEKKIVSGKLWRDTDGNVINAHGGGVLYHEGKYYWFGEHRPESGFVTEKGINCYSSTDLLNWQYEEVALPVSETKGSDIEKGCIMERPKVIYNNKTGKFVMWFHLELKDRGYESARAAVAVSDSPTGPYRFIRSTRVNSGIYPLNMMKKEKRIKWNFSEYEEWWTPKWYDAVKRGMFVKRDLERGQMSRDMTLFVDDDEKAYHIYASEDNLTLQIAELSDDYLSHTGKYIRIFPGGHNEAPAIFKKDGTYWMITSGCTGWEPNKARLLTATAILGEWKQLPNPCIGEKADKTFGGQSTYVLPLQGTENQFVFMADNWRPKSLADSRYIWLPIRFDEKGIPFIEWIDRWKPY